MTPEEWHDIVDNHGLVTYKVKSRARELYDGLLKRYNENSKKVCK